MGENARTVVLHHSWRPPALVTISRIIQEEVNEILESNLDQIDTNAPALQALKRHQEKLARQKAPRLITSFLAAETSLFLRSIFQPGRKMKLRSRALRKEIAFSLFERKTVRDIKMDDMSSEIKKDLCTPLEIWDRRLWTQEKRYIIQKRQIKREFGVRNRFGEHPSIMQFEARWKMCRNIRRRNALRERYGILETETLLSNLEKRMSKAPASKWAMCRKPSLLRRSWTFEVER